MVKSSWMEPEWHFKVFVCWENVCWRACEQTHTRSHRAISCGERFSCWRNSGPVDSCPHPSWRSPGPSDVPWDATRLVHTRDEALHKIVTGTAAHGKLFLTKANLGRDRTAEIICDPILYRNASPPSTLSRWDRPRRKSWEQVPSLFPLLSISVERLALRWPHELMARLMVGTLQVSQGTLMVQDTSLLSSKPGLGSWSTRSMREAVEKISPTISGGKSIVPGYCFIPSILKIHLTSFPRCKAVGAVQGAGFPAGTPSLSMPRFCLPAGKMLGFTLSQARDRNHSIPGRSLP